MKYFLLVALSCITLSACTYTDINFERMSALELAEYNMKQPIAQMIVCSDDDRSFTRIRRRSCLTVEKMYGSADQASQLGVLSSVQGYGNSE